MSLLYRWILVCCFLAVCLFVADASAWNPQVVGGKCKQSGVRCSGTIGNAGQSQGACCDPANGNNLVTCNANNPCIGGRAYKWETSRLPLSWFFNPNGMPGTAGYAGLSQAQIEAALKKGWDGWSTQTCTSFTHNYRGASTVLPSRNGDQQVVLYLASAQSWAQLGGGGSTLAFTIPIPNNNGELQDGDIVFNPSPPRGWGIGNKTDLVGVTAHEVGHAIGFAHAPQTSSLMYYAHSGNFTTLPQDDRDAVCFTYPGSCTKDADCGNCLRCANGRCTRQTIAEVRNLCKPCSGPNDCGGTKDICIRLEEGQRCAQDCSAGCCPVGYRCSSVGLGQMMCLPDIGSCPAVPCTSDAPCGPGESCQGGTCKPKPVPVDPKTCKACTQNSDCGGTNGCFAFPDGNSRCAQPCAVDNFCPTGYTCQGTNSGRFCFPEDFACTCKADTDCVQGEACKSGICRPSSCKYGCNCSDKVPCDAPYNCFQTQSGGLCFQPCGNSGSGTFPPGSPGGTCNNGACTLGAQCFPLQGGSNICLKPCTSNNNCSSTGGRCYQLGNQNFCLCQGDNECLNGQACNKAVLGQSGGGACASKQTSAPCSANFECKDAGGVEICQPKPIRNAGESCGNELACKAGLICLTVVQGSPTGICFEDCTTSNTCTFGGRCLLPLNNNSKACACENNSDCKAPQICLKVLVNGQAGYCGQPTFTCGDNKCEAAGGENCSNCLKDCPCAAGTSCQGGTCKIDTSACGNGTCDVNKGETCGNCLKDCPCTNGQVCTNNACAAPPKNCGNGTCETAEGENCTTCAGDCQCPSGEACNNGTCAKAQTGDCGNGTCERPKGETCITCAVDCACAAGEVCSEHTCGPPPASCGNGTCEANLNENCGTCAKDCPCATGQVCSSNTCAAPPVTCGNGTCEANLNENCGTCAQDCPCGGGQTCLGNTCQTSTPPPDAGPADDDPNKLLCTVENQIEQCDSNGTNCKAVCADGNKGCGCNSTQEQQLPVFFLLLFGGFLLLRRRQTL